MEYRKCGDTNLQLSVIGSGCWAFGGGDYWGERRQTDVDAVVHAAMDYGINYFDTAEAYNEGRSEISLGKAIRGIARDKIIIGSKISPSNCYAKTLEAHCHDSLKRLQTDYIDIYMIHWPIHSHSIKHFTTDDAVISNPPTLDEALRALEKLKQQGKIRTAGISNFSKLRIQEIPESVKPAVNELPYNLLCRAIEFETLPYCKEQGIGVIGYMTLLQGILAGLYQNLDEAPEWLIRTRHFNSVRTPRCRHGENGFEPQTNKALSRISIIAKDYGFSMADIATKWAIANPAITCALIGAKTVEKMEENVNAALEKLPFEIIKALNGITDELKQAMGNHFDYYESKENDRTI